MSKGKTGSSNIIYNSNKEMLDYFNKLFLKDLEDIQELKTQIFELEVRIEEMQKTRNIYAFKSSSRRSVFTPIAPETLVEDEFTFIQNEIQKLEGEKSSLEEKLRGMERSLNVNKKRLASLQDAKKAICDAGLGEDDILSSITETDETGLQFVETDNEQSSLSHNYNILMQNAFDNSFLASMLNKSVIDNIASINHKLQIAESLMSTDTARAKLTLDEVRRNNDDIKSTVMDIIRKIDYPLDSSKPIWLILDEYILQKREQHPECVIEASVECTDYDLKLHPVFSINLIKLLNIFFDNIFQHANANKIDFKLSMTPHKTEVIISDNGVGIKEDYAQLSPWYSSLHRADEIIHLLNGSLKITGESLNGTTVRFSFPIKSQG